jgi:hypothetical protein
MKEEEDCQSGLFFCFFFVFVLWCRKGKRRERGKKVLGGRERLTFAGFPDDVDAHRVLIRPEEGIQDPQPVHARQLGQATAQRALPPVGEGTLGDDGLHARVGRADLDDVAAAEGRPEEADALGVDVLRVRPQPGQRGVPVLLLHVPVDEAVRQARGPAVAAVVEDQGGVAELVEFGGVDVEFELLCCA